jgi:predicted RNA-binding protein with PIN domain
VRYVVDGMNVIGTRPDGWWKDRDAAMLHLVDRLERWAATTGHDVPVVFERKPNPPLPST